MDFLTDWLTDWLKELLIGGIMGNLEGLFDYVNTQVGEIAVQVGTTPAAWNAGVFSLIRQLSETVILPIAGLVLTFVATYELIQMLLEKNNMHEFDVANIYKWIFKTACAIFILSNTFNIVMAVFDVSQTVIAQAGGLIQGSTDITPDMMAELETTLEGMDLGPLLGLWLQSSIIGVTMWALGIVIFVLVYGRMLEIYLLTSLAPIPMPRPMRYCRRWRRKASTALRPSTQRTKRRPWGWMVIFRLCWKRMGIPPSVQIGTVLPYAPLTETISGTGMPHTDICRKKDPSLPSWQSAPPSGKMYGSTVPL